MKFCGRGGYAVGWGMRECRPFGRRMERGSGSEVCEEVCIVKEVYSDDDSGVVDKKNAINGTRND